MAKRTKAEPAVVAPPIAGWCWGGNEVAETVQWLWEPWVPSSSLSLLAGDPMLGKSTLLAHLAAGVTQRPERGKAIGQADSVLWIAGEESWGMAAMPRLVAAGANLGRVIRPEKGKDASSRVTVHQLAAEMVQLHGHGVRLVVVDPLASLAEEGSDWTTESSARQCLDTLQTLASQFCLPIIGTRNWNKRKQGSRLDRICGSAAFRDVPRAILSCIPDPMVRDRSILCLDKWSYGPGATPITYTLDRSKGGAPTWVQGEPCRIDRDDLDGDRITGAERAEWRAAHELIRDMIGNTFADAKAIYSAAGAIGIGVRKVWRAKVELGVRHHREGFGPGSHVVWEPPKAGWPEGLEQIS